MPRKLLFRLWIEFVFAYPAIGVPATIVIIAAIVARQRRRLRAGPQRWDSAPPKEPPTRPASRDLDQIRNLDPEFSVVLFEDFAYALFARAHQARSSPRDLEALSPYLGAAVRSHLAERRPTTYLGAHWYVEHVRRLLDDRYGAEVARAGLTVHTAVNLEVQRMAEDAVTRGIHALAPGPDGDAAPLEGALVALDPASGQVKALAIAGGERWSKLPNVMTASESGLPGFEASVWYALLAPTGTPPDIVTKLNAAANDYIKSEKAKKLFDDLGIQPAGGTPADLKAFMASEVQKWSPIIQAANIKF